jgi:hypothetical protein
MTLYVTGCRLCPSGLGLFYVVMTEEFTDGGYSHLFAKSRKNEAVPFCCHALSAFALACEWPLRYAAVRVFQGHRNRSATATDATRISMRR